MTDRPAKRRSPTVPALAALVGGFAFGIALHGSDAPGVVRLAEGIAVVGQMWVSSLRMAAFPLVILLTLAAIVGARREGSIGSLGARTVALFGAMLLAAGLVAFAVTAPAVALYPIDDATASAFLARGPSGPAPERGAAAPASLAGWLLSLVPTNIFQAAANGEILPILLFTVLFAFGVRRLETDSRELLGRLFQALADAMMTIVGFLLRLLPLGVFSLCAAFAFRAGVRVTGVVAVWIVLVSSVLLFVTLLLYPLTLVAGGVSLRRFARGAAPAQVVAVSTRSSMASLPAMVAGGREHLGFPASATGFVLPLAVASFKLNMTISGPVKLLFLAHVFQRPLGATQLAAFLAIELILSFSTAPIPSMGTIRSIPAYLAAGIPIEAVLLLNAVDTIPDIFKTLVNVTADMSAATILSRGERRHAAAIEAAARPAGVTARSSGSSSS